RRVLAFPGRDPGGRRLLHFADDDVVAIRADAFGKREAGEGVVVRDDGLILGVASIDEETLRLQEDVEGTATGAALLLPDPQLFPERLALGTVGADLLVVGAEPAVVRGEEPLRLQFLVLEDLQRSGQVDLGLVCRRLDRLGWRCYRPES